MIWPVKSLEPLFILIGEVVFYLAILIIFAAVISAILISISFKTGYFPFPDLFVLLIIALEAPIRAIYRFIGQDDAIVDLVCINLINIVNFKSYRKIPNSRKAIFLPQCLRSIECPAELNSEGINCLSCGKCKISEAKKEGESLGFRVFVVPGSSFIKRMIAKYRPGAILGVGCVEEVRNGLDMCQKYRIPAQGIVLDEAGCISTSVNWDRFYEVVRGES